MKNFLTTISFGELLSSTRKLKGWRIKDLIESLENVGHSISPAYFTRIEQYAEIPSPELVLALADLLDIDKKKLLECAKREKIKKFDQSLDSKYLKAYKNYENFKK